MSWNTSNASPPTGKNLTNCVIQNAENGQIMLFEATSGTWINEDATALDVAIITSPGAPFSGDGSTSSPLNFIWPINQNGQMIFYDNGVKALPVGVDEQFLAITNNMPTWQYITTDSTMIGNGSPTSPLQVLNGSYLFTFNMGSATTSSFNAHYNFSNMVKNGGGVFMLVYNWYYADVNLTTSYGVGGTTYAFMVGSNGSFTDIHGQGTPFPTQNYFASNGTLGVVPSNLPSIIYGNANNILTTTFTVSSPPPSPWSWNFMVYVQVTAMDAKSGSPDFSWTFSDDNSTIENVNTST